MNYDILDSTSTTARDMAEEGATEWTVVSAEMQTNGRGRQGNSWVSPKGGLWFSVVLRPSLAPSQSSILQLYSANITRRVLADETGLSIGFKWPNDILCKGSKLGGILVETKTLGEKILYAIVGVGVNLNIAKELLPERATSILTITGKTVDREKLLASIVSGIKAEYDTLDTPEKVAAEWWKYCVHRLKKVKAEASGETLTGISSGIDSLGQLEIQTANGIVTVGEGTVRIL